MGGIMLAAEDVAVVVAVEEGLRVDVVIAEEYGGAFACLSRTKKPRV